MYTYLCIYIILPLQVGKPIEVTVTGKTTVPIEAGASANLKVKVFGVEITHLNLDFCTKLGVTCPLKAGDVYNAKITYPVPSQAPAGVSVTIDLQFNHTNNADAGCVTLQVQLVKPSLQLADAQATSNQFLFTKWAQQHEKKYEVNEVFDRFNIFSDNLETIRKHNEGNHPWTMGMNA